MKICLAAGQIFLTNDGEKEWRNRDNEFADNIENYRFLFGGGI